MTYDKITPLSDTSEFRRDNPIHSNGSGIYHCCPDNYLFWVFHKVPIKTSLNTCDGFKIKQTLFAEYYSSLLGTKNLQFPFKTLSLIRWNGSEILGTFIDHHQIKFVSTISDLSRRKMYWCGILGSHLILNVHDNLNLQFSWIGSKGHIQSFCLESDGNLRNPSLPLLASLQWVLGTNWTEKSIQPFWPETAFIFPNSSTKYEYLFANVSFVLTTINYIKCVVVEL